MSWFFVPFLFLLFLGVGIQSQGAIGPSVKVPQAVDAFLWKIDLRFDNKSILCSGIAISTEYLLTAAHCLPQYAFARCHKNSSDQSASPKACPRIQLDKQFYTSYEVQRHPLYRPGTNGPNYLASSNYDIALVRFPGHPFQRFHPYTSSKKLRSVKKHHYVFFGFGMSQIQKDFSGDHLLESNRGQLRGTSIQNLKPTNGLLRTLQSQFSEPSSLKQPSLSSGQILRSDSGGPLFSGNELIGLARNYKITQNIQTLSQSDDHYHMESFFTDLRDPRIQNFIRSITETASAL